MDRIYFLSDVHLGVGTYDEESRKQALLLQMLSHVRQHASHLCIVGDLFDFWYEYRSVVPRGYHALFLALEELTSAGINVTYLAGNHDFAIGDFFRNDLGIDIVHDDLEFEAQGRHVYLFHGDGLAVRDAGYRFIKRILRSRWAQWMFRWIHPDVGFRLARMFSHSSRDYTSAKHYGETDGMRLEAERRIGAGADIVIMGHRHLPLLEQLNGGVYVNLGDWISFFTYAVLENGSIELWTMKHGTPERFEASS